MTLQKILADWDAPVRPDVIQGIIRHMKAMPAHQENVVLACAEHLNATQTLGSVLAVVHALNGGEFLLRSHDDDDEALEKDLSSEFEKLLEEACSEKK